MNKVTLTINSRQYTVVAEESEEYIKALGKHINEKINTVLESGTNIFGERPLILAALNICDEYFKVYEAGNLLNEQMERCTKKLEEQIEENQRLLNENKQMRERIENMRRNQSGYNNQRGQNGRY